MLMLFASRVRVLASRGQRATSPLTVQQHIYAELAHPIRNGEAASVIFPPPAAEVASV